MDHNPPMYTLVNDSERPRTGNTMSYSSTDTRRSSLAKQSATHVYPGGTYSAYAKISSDEDLATQYAQAAAVDEKLKHRIRVLKLVSRIVAVCLSAATLAPITMTLIKFLETKNVYFEVDGKQRTAWANGTIAWYTYMYFGVSFLSFILDVAVMFAYFHSLKRANKIADVASFWAGSLIVAHIITWGVAVALYRYGKVPVDGKFKDLWGWTCSTSAGALQHSLPSVEFKKYCGIQTTAFYTGLVQACAGILSALVYGFSVWRIRSKKRVTRTSSLLETEREAARWWAH